MGPLRRKKSAVGARDKRGTERTVPKINHQKWSLKLLKVLLLPPCLLRRLPHLPHCCRVWRGCWACRLCEASLGQLRVVDLLLLLLRLLLLTRVRHAKRGVVDRGRLCLSGLLL